MARALDIAIATDANGNFSAAPGCRTCRLVGIQLAHGTVSSAGSAIQTITLTGNTDAGDSFTLTYNGITTVPFVNGTNMTAAAIQAALRTATTDNGLLVSGTTNAGPFTVTFSASFGFALPITGTPGTDITGVTVVQTALGSTLLFQSIGRTLLKLTNWAADGYYPVGELVDTAAGAASASYGEGGMVIHSTVQVTLNGGGAGATANAVLIYELD